MVADFICGSVLAVAAWLVIIIFADGLGGDVMEQEWTTHDFISLIVIIIAICIVIYAFAHEGRGKR